MSSVAQSARELLRAVMESTKTELSSSEKPTAEVKASQSSKPQAERKKIVISIQGMDGQKQFRVYSVIFSTQFYVNFSSTFLSRVCIF